MQHKLAVTTDGAATSEVPMAALTEAVLTASRVLVAVAARSLAGAEESVSLPQYRVLVVLASRGPQRVVDLAAALGVNPSTATRVCDNLAAKRLIRRQRSTSNRREVRVALTHAGRLLVDGVTTRRRAEITRIVASVPPESRVQLVDALRALAEAAGEIPDPDWALGWAE
jgi:DNA-binding MarR family transcriptional regulator